MTLFGHLLVHDRPTKIDWNLKWKKWTNIPHAAQRPQSRSELRNWGIKKDFELKFSFHLSNILFSKLQWTLTHLIHISFENGIQQRLTDLYSWSITQSPPIPATQVIQRILNTTLAKRKLGQAGVQQNRDMFVFLIKSKRYNSREYKKKLRKPKIILWNDS